VCVCLIQDIYFCNGDMCVCVCVYCVCVCVNRWEGKGLKEVGKDQNGKIIVRIDSKYFRPTEVEFLKGDHAKITKALGWKPKIAFNVRLYIHLVLSLSPFVSLSFCLSLVLTLRVQYLWY